jgi:hypothetical protein
MDSARPTQRVENSICAPNWPTCLLGSAKERAMSQNVTHSARISLEKYKEKQ